MSVRICPAPTVEGACYARMLEIELEEHGIRVGDDAPCHLVLIDADMPEYAEYAAASGELPVLFYGTSALPPEGVEEEDYLPRPLDLERLCARCMVQESGEATRLLLGMRAKEASYCAQPLGLTEKEYRVLCCLVAKEGGTVSRAELLAEVWGQQAGGEGSNVVDVCIRNLRKKLDERFGIRLIVSVRGEGYRYQPTAEQG